MAGGLGWARPPRRNRTTVGLKVSFVVVVPFVVVRRNRTTVGLKGHGYNAVYALFSRRNRTTVGLKADLTVLR